MLSCIYKIDKKINEFKLYKNNIINIKMELDTILHVMPLVINEKKTTKKNT
jgi:hypothetical protein